GEPRAGAGRDGRATGTVAGRLVCRGPGRWRPAPPGGRRAPRSGKARAPPPLDGAADRERGRAGTLPGGAQRASASPAGGPRSVAGGPRPLGGRNTHRSPARPGVGHVRPHEGGGTLPGVLTCVRCPDSASLRPTELAFLRTIAGRAAEVIARSRRLQEAE